MNDRTTEILNRFSNSWTETEKFYDDLIKNYQGFERLKPLRQFIDLLKQQGESKYFRLGTSIHILVISRSVNHGLRPDQKRIKIDTINTNDFVVTLIGDGKIYREYRIKSLDDSKLKNLLETLKHTLVD